MADDVEMTPISPAEGGSVPPKVSPFGAAPSASPSAGVSTIKLKPVIRKPMIHKPTIGAKPPVPPAAPVVPPAPAKKATQNLKSVTGPIPVQATLKKTGIIAEGIITPQQQQAAKSKTSRISLESAIGVAPAKEGPAPLKTIRLRRPTDLKPMTPSPIQTKPAETVVQPAPQQAAAAPAPAPAAPAPAPAQAPAPEAPIEDSVTQKKTLKLHRPGGVGIKPPSIGIQKPAADGVQDVPDMGGDVPDLSPVPPMDFASLQQSAPSAGGPAWLTAISLVVSLAALAAVGYLVWELYCHIADAGANEILPFV